MSEESLYCVWCVLSSNGSQATFFRSLNGFRSLIYQNCAASPERRHRVISISQSQAFQELESGSLWGPILHDPHTDSLSRSLRSWVCIVLVKACCQHAHTTQLLTPVRPRSTQDMLSEISNRPFYYCNPCWYENHMAWTIAKSNHLSTPCKNIYTINICRAVILDLSPRVQAWEKFELILFGRVRTWGRAGAVHGAGSVGYCCHGLISEDNERGSHNSDRWKI